MNRCRRAGGRRSAPAVAACLALLGGGTSLAGGLSELPAEEIRANVERQVINLGGRLEAFERVVLPARVEGYLRVIRFDLGDRVAAGEVIAEVDVPELETQKRAAAAYLEEARARLRQAEAVLRFKERIAIRLHRLARRRRGAVTAEEMDRADDERAAAAAEVAVREAALRVATARLENLDARLAFARIRAPFDGIVSRRLVHTGALITAATPVVELVREGKLRLVLDIPQRIAPYLREGNRLRIRFNALPGKAFSASVSRVSAVLDGNRLRAEADLPWEAGLLPGMRATVAVRMW